MHKKLSLLLLTVVAAGCSQDIDPPLVTDLEIQSVEILDPSNRAAFCAGTGTLTVRLRGFEYYWDSMKQKKAKLRDFDSKPGLGTTRVEYANGVRMEPCGNFNISFDHVDSYGHRDNMKNGYLSDQCQIRLHRPIVIQAGSTGNVASAYVTHTGRMSDANTFKDKFQIPCP